MNIWQFLLGENIEKRPYIVCGDISQFSFILSGHSYFSLHFTFSLNQLIKIIIMINFLYILVHPSLSLK